MGHLFEVTDIGEHREDGFDDHADIPLAALTDTQILWVPINLFKAGIREEHHVMPEFIDEMLKSGTIVDIGGVTLPINDASEVIKDKTELTTHNPALIGNPFFADLRCAAAFT